MISKRSRGIILEIFKQGVIKTSELAVMFKVSERTIRMDLEEIDYFLKCNGYDTLLRYGKKGISFQETNMSTSLIYKLINQKDVVTASYSKEERLLEILYVLGIRSHPMKIEELAEELLVSKSTIVKDLERLKMLLEKEKFQIQGSLDGIELVGDESTIRSWIVKQFIETMDKQTVVDIVKLVNGKDEIITYKVYWRLFEKIDLIFVTHVTEVLKSMLCAHLSDSLYLQILGNLCFMMKRVQIKKEVNFGQISYRSNISRIVVEKLFVMMSKQIPIRETEKIFLQYIVHIALPVVYEIENPDYQKEIAEHAKELVHRMSVYMKYQDQSVLYNDICEEMLFMRIEDELMIPVLKNVVEIHEKEYEDMYIKIKEEVTWLSFLHHQVNNDDYWRIAWHFIANRQQPYLRQNVLIVSDKSKSLITILIRKLKKMFDIEIIGICSYSQLEKYMDSYPVDCIVSTMKLPNELNAIRVHPLLNEKDIQFLKQFLATHQHTVPMRIHEPFQNYYYKEDSTNLLDIIKHVDKQLLKYNIMNVSCLKELNINIKKLKEEYMIQGNILIISIRNHEFIKQNAVIIAELDKVCLINSCEIQEVRVIAGISSREYIAYIENILSKKEDAYEGCYC